MARLAPGPEITWLEGKYATVGLSVRDSRPPCVGYIRAGVT